jgi:hypothetical protein
MSDFKYTAPRPVATLDSECYQNYWSIGFRSVADGRVRVFEKYDGQPLDRLAIARILRSWRVISFNGMNYDMPMIALAMNGADNATLKRASDDIILSDLRAWDFYERYQVTLPDFIDHIDTMEVSPGSPTKPSLKIYAGRLHSKRMQDLPFEPDQWITPDDREVLCEYLGNDLTVTQDLYLELKSQIDLRSEMSEQYGVDVRSKSDAQVAEAVLKTELQRITGRKIYRPEIKPGTFNYKPASWVRFITPEMREMLNKIKNAPFVVDHAGTVCMPQLLEDAKMLIGKGAYRMGIGGLHSSESKATHVSDDGFVLLDRDVTSYYPSIILNGGLYPKHLGQQFLDVYRSIFQRRLAAKKAGNKSVAETLKIVLNGSFGKLGSPWSVLYSPDLMIQTTLTGQLAVLMLIEAVEANGIEVVSANTDGFVSKVPRARRDFFNALVFDWECDTGFGTEETEYRALHSRDVNNYIAIGQGGKVKLKGAYAPGGPGQPGAAGMKKNPDCEISTDAVVAYLKDGTPLEETIHASTDITKFVTIRRVKGGAEKDGAYLGKAIRWYYAEGETGTITYRTNGNTVPSTEGARPCMQLPDEFPTDINYAWYVREANAILQDVGARSVDPALVGRNGVMVARLPDQKTYHIVTLPFGAAHCGRQPASIREKWVEVDDVPMGQRLCAQCRTADTL